MATLVALPAASPTAAADSREPAGAPTRAEMRPALEALSPARHRLELTVSGELRAKLERARDLLGHAVPSGDLEAVIERAVDALLTKLEKQRSKVEREVFARDGEQCTFTDEHDIRCTSRTRLELDHIIPRARGGSSEAANLRVVCRAHNRLYAEQVFGRDHIERQIDQRQRQRRSDEGTHEVASRALTGLGFRDRDVRKALTSAGPASGGMSDLIRAAITLLTPA